MKLSIRNFRSIKQADVELAPITVLYGSNGAGKSSLLYALLAFKNVVSNPDQQVDEFFNLEFADLGGFRAVIFDGLIRREIAITLEVELSDRTRCSYSVNIGEKSGAFEFSYDPNLPQTDADVRVLEFSKEVRFPYTINENAAKVLQLNGIQYAISWNGISNRIVSVTGPPNTPALSPDILVEMLNTPVRAIRQTAVVPSKRGFSLAMYGYASPSSPFVTKEQEVVAGLAEDPELLPKVSLYLQQILERNFDVRRQPRVQAYWLEVVDKVAHQPSQLVNDGFGVSQLVYLLAKCLDSKNQIVCIEEPEIHLHPLAIRRLAAAFVRMVQEEGKQLIITTHSESFLLALLALVSKRELNPTELACYWVTKDEGETHFNPQEVNEDGQIAGGLSSFMAGELEDIAAFLGVQMK